MVSKYRMLPVAVAVCVSGSALFAQTVPETGALAGVVTDPSGAAIAGAVVHVTGEAIGDAVDRTVTTDAGGRFSADLPVGSYTVEISSPGFQVARRTSFVVSAGVRASVAVKLTIETQSEEVNVPSDTGASTEAAANKSALVFKGAQLQALSNDDATLQKQLLAIAGGGDGEKPPQILIDGFSGGRFPPKSSIREVRINQNPYSAEYDSLGWGRIEIFTKPGSDKVHGFVQASGNDTSFNARNPFTGAQPPYYSFYLDGNISGPLGKKTSYFLGTSHNDLQNNAVVNAVVLDGGLNSAALSQAVPNPSLSHSYSARLDRQLTTANTFTSRYEYNSNAQRNQGVGLLTLASEAADNNAVTQTLQIGNTAIVNPKLISETRFQYVRTRSRQTPASVAPALIVQGSFNGGGAPAQVLSDNQDRYEWQEYLSLDRGKHFLRAGVRYRLLRDANFSTSNYNGQYVFPDLATYQITERGVRAGLTGAEIRAQGGGATQFNLTAGQPSASVLTGDVGVYLDDEWKARKNVTLNFGFRLESQTAIPDHFDPAPRVGFAWEVKPREKKAALAVVRGGFGVFYDRFESGDILTAIRQNGVSQQSFFLKNPDFYPAVPPPSALGSVQPTVYQISPHLRSAYELVTAVSVEHSFGKYGNVSATYLLARGVHQFLSRNINAPLDGTYDPADPTSGVRPLGGTRNLYQFSSDGVAQQKILFVNYNLNLGKRAQIWGFVGNPRRNADSFGANSFPSDQYDLRVDYGAVPWRRNLNLFTGGELRLPMGFTLDPFLVARGGPRFNITTGQDLNGDTQYNDRPAFATDMTRASVVRTPYGNFDTAPLPWQARIPINYGHAPAFVSLQLALNKSFKFGALPKPAADAPKPAPGAPGAEGKPDPPYELGFGVEGQNVFNHTNAGRPIGVLSSPFFGRSISLDDNFSGNTAANRTVNLRAFFRF